VTALDAWLGRADITAGPIFRKVTRYGTITRDAVRPSAVALIVKRTAVAAGLAPDRLAGHSLRAGLVSTAASRGAAGRAGMVQTGYRSIDTLAGSGRSADTVAESLVSHELEGAR